MASKQPLGMKRSKLKAMVDESFPNSKDDLVVVVTGATGGIGKTLCRVIVELGGTVIAIDMNQDALEHMIEDIATRTNDASERKIIPVVSDFCDLDSVSEAAQTILDSVHAIDILVNNAGIFYGMEDDLVETLAKTTLQGYDACFQINYLSHFLLTEKLLTKLSGRVVHVTSGLHYGVDGSGLLPTGDQDPAASLGSNWAPTHISDSYGNSKLGQIWHACWLNRRKDGLLAVSACPSWSATGIAGNDEGREILEQYAFPTMPVVGGRQHDGETNQSEPQAAGPAMTSILYAMFCPKDKLGNQALTGEKIMGNSRVFDEFSPSPEFVQSDLVYKLFGGRAKFVYLFASWVVLFLQRWYHDGDFILQSTSPESSNIQGQDALCSWSEQAVSPWLAKDKQRQQIGSQQETRVGSQQ